jgi:TonB family protein
VTERTTVIVAAHLAQDGTVIEDSILVSSGDPKIDQDALNRVLSFKVDHGEETDIWRTIPVVYAPE